MVASCTKPCHSHSTTCSNFTTLPIIMSTIDYLLPHFLCFAQRNRLKCTQFAVFTSFFHWTILLFFSQGFRMCRTTIPIKYSTRHPNMRIHYIFSQNQNEPHSIILSKQGGAPAAPPRSVTNIFNNGSFASYRSKTPPPQGQTAVPPLRWNTIFRQYPRRSAW